MTSLPPPVAAPVRAPGASFTPPASAKPGSIFTPAIDLLLVGGLSLIFFVPLLLSGRTDLVLVGAGAQAWIGTAINMPHFMASYRLVYRDRETVMKHKWASIYVPLILVAYIVFAVLEIQYFLPQGCTEAIRASVVDPACRPLLMTLLIAIASGYLAWHYTGQVWGMMASYAYLGGARFEKSERLLIRTGLRILLAWHVCWFVYTQLDKPFRGVVRPVYIVVSAGIGLAFLLGAIGLFRMWRRTGVLPPARTLVAWIALFVWYAMMARDPRALFWIQIAHALQYLAFPVRVEINRTIADRARGATRLARHMALYGLGLLVVSVVVAQLVPGTAMSIIGNVFGETPGKSAPILLLMFINIHHYFTDGVIWKISNPEVRKDLFAHVLPPDKGGKSAKAGKGGKSGGESAGRQRVAYEGETPTAPQGLAAPSQTRMSMRSRAAMVASSLLFVAGVISPPPGSRPDSPAAACSKAGSARFRRNADRKRGALSGS